MPFPYHLPMRFISWVYLYYLIRPKPCSRCELWFSACCNYFIGSLCFPGNRKNVPVGHDCKIMMVQVLLGSIFKVPQHISIPAYFFYSTALPSTFKYREVRVFCIFYNGAIILQIGVKYAI